MSRQRESCKATPKLTEDEEQWATLTLDALLPILRGLRSCMWYPCSGKGPRGKSNGVPLAFVLAFRGGRRLSRVASITMNIHIKGV